MEILTPTARRLAQVLLVVYLCIWDIVYSEFAPLDDYILHHEGLNYDTTHLKTLHSRRERSADESVRLKFTAYGRTFRLNLKLDPTIFKNGHEMDFGGDVSRNSINVAFRGEVTGSPGSRVTGSIINGVFHGEIHEPNTPTFHIEPSDRFFKGNPPYHSVIYSEKHLEVDPYRHLRGNHSQFASACGYQAEHSHQHDWDLPKDFEPKIIHDELNEHRLHRYRRAVTNGQLLGSSSSPNTCNLELQSDPYLWRYMTDSRLEGGLGLPPEQAKDEILSLFVSHVNSLNDIFTKTRFSTFNNQTWFRGVTFIVQRSRVMTWTSERCDDPPNAGVFCRNNYDVNALLYQSSLTDHSAFCLSYLFTYRDFQRGTLGLAWVAKPSSGLTGGICETFRDSVEANNRRVKKSLNTGVVSLLNYGKTVAVRVSQLTFAHEVGHSFGAEHDTTGTCAPYKTSHADASKGNYIMYSSANPGNMVNNNKFSPCSKDYIAKVLHAVINKLENKRNCFEASNVAYCGNTIVEEGEECDCGFIEDCSESCCNPRTEGSLNHCTLRPDPNNIGQQYQCSPSEGPCCYNSNCTYVLQQPRVLCSPEDECSLASYCNGFSGRCPPSVSVADNTFCDANSHVCENGQCIGSICKRIGWDECFLNGDWQKQSEEMCYVSCKDPTTGDCVSSKNTTGMNNYPQFKQLLTEVGNGSFKSVQLPAGSPCRNFEGYCDVFLKCRKIDAEGALKRLLSFFDASSMAEIQQWMQQYWWAVLLMCVALVLLMAGFIKLCSYSTPTYAPGRKPRSQQKEIREVNPLHDAAQNTRRQSPPITHQSRSPRSDVTPSNFNFPRSVTSHYDPPSRFDDGPSRYKDEPSRYNAGPSRYDSRPPRGMWDEPPPSYAESPPQYERLRRETPRGNRHY